MSGRLVIPVIVGVGGVACGPELPPVRYETEHLRVGTDFEDDVCAGSLSALEAHIDFVEGELGIELDTTIDFYWFDGPADQFCDGYENCATDEPRQVFTSWEAARHELVHAVVFEVGAPDNFIAEGLADAFDGRKTEFGSQAPLNAIGFSIGDVDYPSAAHFARWLHATEGNEQLHDFIVRSSPAKGPADARGAFASSFGEDLAEVDLRFFAEAPERYPTTVYCDLPALNWEGGLETVVTLACDEEHTYGFRTMWRSWTFDVDEPGWYVVSIEDPGQVVLSECGSELIALGEELPPRPNPPVGEDPGGSHDPLEPIPFGGETPFQQLQTVYLRATRHRVDVGVPSSYEQDVLVTVQRRIGPASP